MRSVVPVIDLFAGPGGLGEGFSIFRPTGRSNRAFRIVLSVEKDPYAHQTLLLRSFFRQFPEGDAPVAYYDYLRGKIETQAQLFDAYPVQIRAARDEAMLRALGEDNREIYAAIDRRLERHGRAPRVLIGGPPCQAYSVAGRSRMQGAMETDSRQVLYQEYLKIIARVKPAVFVMENVKGILSSQVKLDANARPHADGKQERIFDRILRDLKQPGRAVRENDSTWTTEPGGEPAGYRIYSLVVSKPDPNMLRPEEFIIRAEEYGVPQMRHRVILLGVREDISAEPETLDPMSQAITIESVLRDLPPLRSQLSPRKDQPRDSPEEWRKAVEAVLDSSWFQTIHEIETTEPVLDLFDDKLAPSASERLRTEITRAVAALQWEAGTGKLYVKRQNNKNYLRRWFYDPRFHGVCNHDSRGHMPSDLHRYLFLACYARVHQVSPTMRRFPPALLPAHDNLKDLQTEASNIFDDRFRVQVADRPATTVTAHISKDGHYNVHFDPTQCRSLTVREAARVQTFPDNYRFEGPRTEQYRQVGNAVPPFLARKIARVVYRLLEADAATNRE